MDELKALVDEFVTLNDDNLAQTVIDNNDVQWCLSELRDMLHADVAPVVHGRWIADGDGYHWTYNCSICAWKDGYPLNERHNYCPNCGAKMDGGVENAVN